MITVNLRPDLKRKRARPPMQGALEGLRGLGSKIKDPLLLVAVVSWVAVVGWLGIMFVTTAHELSALSRSWSSPAPRTSGSRPSWPRSGTRR